MTKLSEKLLHKYYSRSVHPYKIYEKKIDTLLSENSVVLDAGCGRGVPVLKKYIGRAKRLIGVELVDFSEVPPGI